MCETLGFIFLLFIYVYSPWNIIPIEIFGIVGLADNLVILLAILYASLMLCYYEYKKRYSINIRTN